MPVERSHNAPFRPRRRSAAGAACINLIRRAMELRQLEYFIAIAETGAFSRAAVRLCVGQPVLSRQIKALEQELGTELYYRTGRGIVLSEAGRILEQHARGVLETTAGARRAISALGSAPAGRVVIGMPPSVGAVLTAPLVRQFRAEFPRVSLGVMDGFSGGNLGPFAMTVTPPP